MERGEEGGAEERLVRDANGAILRDGDTVTVVKDLKIKGSSSVVKVGTKVRNMASLLVALIVGLTAQIVILRKQ
jgi:protein PhnA